MLKMKKGLGSYMFMILVKIMGPPVCAFVCARRKEDSITVLLNIYYEFRVQDKNIL